MRVLLREVAQSVEYRSNLNRRTRGTPLGAGKKRDRGGRIGVIGSEDGQQARVTSNLRGRGRIGVAGCEAGSAGTVPWGVLVIGGLRSC